MPAEDWQVTAAEATGLPLASNTTPRIDVAPFLVACARAAGIHSNKQIATRAARNFECGNMVSSMSILGPSSREERVAKHRGSEIQPACEDRPGHGSFKSTAYTSTAP